MLSLNEVVTVMKRILFSLKGVKGRTDWAEIIATKRRSDTGRMVDLCINIMKNYGQGSTNKFNL